jgi:hypothetical protein
MRLIEILGGYRIPVSNEENDLINKIKQDGSLLFDDLTDREKQLSYDLYRRNVVKISDETNMISLNKMPPLEDIDW